VVIERICRQACLSADREKLVTAVGRDPAHERENRPFRSGSRLSVGQARRGGRKGGVGGIPPVGKKNKLTHCFIIGL